MDSNGLLPTRDTFYLFNFYKDYYTLQCVPILQSNVTHRLIFPHLRYGFGILASLILLSLNTMNDLILYLTHQKLNLMDVLICVENVLTVLFYKTKNLLFLCYYP